MADSRLRHFGVSLNRRHFPFFPILDILDTMFAQCVWEFCEDCEDWDVFSGSILFSLSTPAFAFFPILDILDTILLVLFAPLGRVMLRHNRFRSRLRQSATLPKTFWTFWTPCLHNTPNLGIAVELNPFLPILPGIHSSSSVFAFHNFRILAL